MSKPETKTLSESDERYLYRRYYLMGVEDAKLSEPPKFKVDDCGVVVRVSLNETSDFYTLIGKAYLQGVEDFAAGKPKSLYEVSWQYGRKVGAVGMSSPGRIAVLAVDVEEARLGAYEKYEHLSGVAISLMRPEHDRQVCGWCAATGFLTTGTLCATCHGSGSVER
jgi:hypothetical protein